jgi:flagellar motor switch protein FliM
MERVLSQEEIDAMVRNARGAGGENQRAERTIKPCTFRQSGQLSVENVRAVSALHEAFARDLAHSLAVYLGLPFEAKLVSVEQIPYGEFLESVPEITYMATFLVSPMNASAALQIDPGLVFSLIDVLLGGTSRCDVKSREMSEIEAELMAEVAKIICRELAKSWEPLGITLELEKPETGAQLQRFLPSTEKTLCLSFEIKVGDTQGMLNLVAPFAVSHPLLRKVSCEAASPRTHGKRHSADRLKAKMLDCLFPAALELRGIQLPVHDVLALSPGDVRSLHVPLRQPAALILGGRQVFEARPVRQERLRAAQIGEAFGSSENSEKDPARDPAAATRQGAQS